MPVIADLVAWRAPHSDYYLWGAFHVCAECAGRDGPMHVTLRNQLATGRSHSYPMPNLTVMVFHDTRCVICEGLLNGNEDDEDDPGLPPFPICTICGATDPARFHPCSDAVEEP